MRIFLFLMSAVLCLGVLVTGHLHWQNKLTAAGIEGKQEQEKIILKEQEEKQARIKSLDPKNNPTQATIDFLLYKALTQENVVIAAVGSNGTAGSGASHPSKTWPELLERGLRLEFPELKNLKITKRGYEGYTTTDLINSGKINDVIAGQPDLVILENAVLNNYNQSISLEQTNQEIENLVTSLQTGLPNSKIMLLSPNPIVNSENRNNLKLTYLDYLDESMEKITEKKWPYMDSNGEILTKISKENIVLADIMASDHFHLNDRGYYLWYEVIVDFIKNNSL